MAATSPTASDAPLTRSQRYIWIGHHGLPEGSRHEFNIVMSYTPPQGSSVESLTAALEHLSGRHQALRTTFPADGPYGASQRVRPPGPPSVVVHRTELPATSEAVSAFARADFELENDLPMRACVVTTGGRPRRLLVVVHHIAVDDWSLGLMTREFEEIHRSMLNGSVPALAPVGRRPLELAHWQQTEQGRERNAAALAYWGEQLRSAPPDVFDRRRGERPGAGSYSASLTSPRAAAAARELAARHGVWPSDVYGAVFAAVLSAYTGHRTVPVRNYFGNREAEWQKHLLACLLQPVPMSLELVEGDAFDTVVKRWGRRFELSREHADAAYDEVLELTSRVGRLRRTPVRVGAVVNYLGRHSSAHGARRAMFTRNPEPRAWAHLDEDAYFRVYDHQDAAVLALNATAEVMGEEDVEALLRGIDALLDSLVGAPGDAALDGVLEGVLSGATPTGSAGAAPDGLDRLARCLEEVPGVIGAHVVAGEHGSGPVAHVAGAVAPEFLRAHVLDRAHGVGGLVCPGLFVVCAEPPADPSSVRNWEERSTTASGEGRGVGLDQADGRECALAAAVMSANSLPGVDLDDDYVAVGGRVARIPHLRRLLEQQGWDPPTLTALSSIRPLRLLAGRMRPLVPEAADPE
ncbi:condensation domain-containing protein [Nocardiopsis sp. CA-288880]|uniref:condensation domain-containing protein n=1 Tax=Nocardiopsis sp. CA-288880 TaxID=3239995 RepID=UPI003D972BA8